MACEATPVTDTASIKTKTKLNQNITLPVNAKVAFYVDKSVKEDKINFIGKMEEALELVGNDMFSNAEPLTSKSDFDFLIKVKTNSDWNYTWGGWESDIELDIVDKSGSKLYSTEVTERASGTGGFYDFHAVFNANAEVLKEQFVTFINRNADIVSNPPELDSLAIKDLFVDFEPTSSGTGFFINNTGHSMTAAHVVEDCVFVELQHKGQVYEAAILASSRLLDLAVLEVNFNNESSVTIEEETSASLGKQIFATGYPLSGILSDYPSLTVGNISSLGGLKGAQGFFQFSAPVQPGNSGGPVTDYRGNLMGLVSSSLNQAMLLKETGTSAQNLNFAVKANIITRFLDKHSIEYNTGVRDDDFETSSKLAVEYSNQILCYQ
jgi:S1-C subfamily serine protease